MSGAPPLVIVAAIAKNGALGMDNQIPWRAPSDLKRFKDITLGRPLIMGRKTYESIGKPLPGRETVVVTRDPLYLADKRPENVYVAHDFDAAVALAAERAGVLGAAEIVVAGGAALYALALPRTQKLRLTLVDCAPQADAFFPQVDWDEWQEICREKPARGPKDEVDLEYVDYTRRRA